MAMVALALNIACRSEPGPLSFVFVTVKVAARAFAPKSRSKTQHVRLAGHSFLKRGMLLLINLSSGMILNYENNR
jgi:hypothetical protein